VRDIDPKGIIMLNRTLQVKLLKTSKEDLAQPTQTSTTYEAKVAVIGNLFERIAAKVGSAVIVYVVVDTVRKVLIAKASK
jgi:hypothetical protein